MDASERLSIELALQPVLHPAGSCDLLLSAVAAALKCHRRAAVCRPCPPDIKHGTAQEFAAVVQALEHIPAALLQAASCELALQHASNQQLQLLRWLLLHMDNRRNCQLTAVTAAQLAADMSAAGWQLSGLRQHLHTCRCIFEIHPHYSKHSPTQGSKRLAALHGTDFANLHSILHNGLLAASGTRLQTYGALFGSGIYLSTDFNVSYSFSKAREGWNGSGLGKHLRCMLMCEVDQDAAVQGANQANASSSLPNTYILVPKPQDVLLRYLLVFSDDTLLGHVPAGSQQGQGRRRHGAAAVCMAITCAYVCLMLLLAIKQLVTWDNLG